MVRKILRSGDPRLRKPCKPVKKIDKKVISIINDLKDTLKVQKDPEGVGLAANQIGENLRVFAMVDKNKIRIIINPEIISTSDQSKPKSTPNTPKIKSHKQIMEGCLSLPNYYSPLKRVQKIKIKYLNIDGKEKVEEFTGFPAQIIGHEIDHLNGIMFLDRLLEQKKKLYKLEKDGWGEVEL
jgi:peptide deformylase